METVNGFSRVTAGVIAETARRFGTPVYLYDEALVAEKCTALQAMPNAFGLTVRYAMKANSNKSLLRVIHSQGLRFDASSLNEVRRAVLAGIPCADIMLTTQEVPDGADRHALEKLLREGMKYNVCSLRQLELVHDFAAANHIRLAMRVHPGVGSGETAKRNTGDEYSCFGVHLKDIGQALQYTDITFDHVHVHIGSGADPELWRQNIDRELGFVEEYFPDAVAVSFGGGLKEARMPDEQPADIGALGAYAKARLEDFYRRTGRKLRMEIEPGNFVMANAGYAIARVIDKKKTERFQFVIADGGMEINTRPSLYGARHPFYVISPDGRLRSSEFGNMPDGFEAVLVGKCCETGDSQCLNREGYSTPRKMAEPECGDLVVIGGAGAYCASMSPMNYNSHVQAPEVLLTREGDLREIRRRQTLEQLTENEI